MPQVLRHFLGVYRGQIAIIVVLLLMQAIGQLWLPSLNADIINDGVLRGDATYIVRVGAVMLAVTLYVGVLAVASSYVTARVAMGFGRDVRGRLFSQVQSFSAHEVSTFGAPSLINRTTGDVQQMQMLVVIGLTIMVSAPLNLVGGIFMALRENAQLSMLFLVVLPLMATAIGLVMWRAVPLFRAVQKKLDTINQVMREQLTGVRVIRAFVRTEYEQARFDRANTDLMNTSLTVNRLFAVMQPTMWLIVNFSSISILWWGGHLVNNNQMQIGSLTAYLSYMMQILLAVLMAVMSIVMVARAAASGERIREVLDVQPVITDPVEPLPAVPARRGDITFENVTFRYGNAADDVLQDVSLHIPAGSTTAIVGSTGSGKTTLLNLIPRLFDVSAGSVSVNGVDVRDQTQHDLWATMAVVPQKAFLFSGTVADNLRYANPDATDDQLWYALTVAQVGDVVRSLDGDLAARITQGGTNVSGGQRQRLSIARALVRRPAIYLFDDSFSALDASTDAKLRAALASEASNATMVIVAQRITSIMSADQIIVLNEGRVVGVGTHDELMVHCPTYEQIARSQLAGAH